MSMEFVSFLDEMRKKRIAFYYPQHAYRGPVYGIDDDTQGKVKLQSLLKEQVCQFFHFS